MKILVPIKRVIDHNVKVRLAKDGSGAEMSNVKMSMNPFDEIAVEEALRLKEQGVATEIIVVSVGIAACQDVLRSGLALGADRGILVETDQTLFPLDVAKILKAIAETETPGCILMGKQAIDDDCNQTGQMLAALLDWPQGTFLSSCKITDTTAEITREIDGGLEELKVPLPAILTTDLRLNTPRYATLPNIMKAKQKPLSMINLEDLDITLTPSLKIMKYDNPIAPSPGKILESVDDLVQKLKQEGAIA